MDKPASHGKVLEAAGVPLILNLSFNTPVYCHNLVALQSAESAKQITATEPSHNISPPTGLERIGGRWEEHSKNVCRLKKKPLNELNPIVAIHTDAYANKLLPHVAVPVRCLA